MKRTSAIHRTSHISDTVAAPFRVSLKALFIAVIAASLVIAASVPAFATSTPPAITDSGLHITYYDISKNGDYTGAINKGDRITATFNVTDNNADLNSLAGISPRAQLNTESFSVTSPSDTAITVSNLQKTTTGWTYTLQFVGITYTGKGKSLIADIAYEGTWIPIISLKQEISRCVEQTESTDKPTVKGTGFVLKASSYGSGPIYAGQAFTLSLTWLATNGEQNVDNVTVGVTPPAELALKDGSSLVYIGTVAPGKTVPVSYTLLPGANVNEGSYSVVVDIKGVNASSGSDVSAQASVTVPVLQPERFEILNSELPSDLTIGASDGGYGSIVLVNRGKGTIANIFVSVTGEGLSAQEGKQYLGNIAGGEQKTADFNISATVTGQVDAKVVINYENARGESMELTHDFSVNVQEAPETDPSGSEPPEGEQPDDTAGGFPAWAWIPIGVVVLAAIVTGILLLKRRKAKKAAALEALDDDYEDDEA